MFRSIGQWLQKRFAHLNPHAFTSHRERTRRYFLHHDMPYPLDCAVLGHKPVWIPLSYGDKDPAWSGYIECARCTLRPRIIGMRERTTSSAWELFQRAVRDGEVVWTPRRAETHLEISRTFVDNLSVQFSIGNAGSETPLDGHLIIPGWRGFYFGTSLLGRRISHWRSRRADENGRYKTRVFGFHVDKEQVRWELGSFRHEWSKDDPQWMQGHWNFKDTICGRAVFNKIEHASADVLIPMPEGFYPAVAQPETCTWTRKRFIKPIVRHSIDFRVEGGVPNGREKYGDWDSTWGFGISVPSGDFTDWQTWAPELAAASLLKGRARYASATWVPPEDARNPRMVTA